jgi:hypothetical protein
MRQTTTVIDRYSSTERNTFGSVRGMLLNQ